MTNKYVKLVDNVIEYAPINKGSILNYNTCVELLKQDGYKLFIPVERPQTHLPYSVKLKETEDTIEEEIVYNETEEEYNERLFNMLKIEKQAENTRKAKKAVEDGYVEFKGALFETNTQTATDLDKERQLCIINGETSSQWLSMDDKIVTLDINTESEQEDDFVKIGFLVKAFKNNVWINKYLIYKQQIESAETLEEIQGLVINY